MRIKTLLSLMKIETSLHLMDIKKLLIFEDQNKKVIHGNQNFLFFMKIKNISPLWKSKHRGYLWKSKLSSSRYQSRLLQPFTVHPICLFLFISLFSTKWMLPTIGMVSVLKKLLIPETFDSSSNKPDRQRYRTRNLTNKYWGT